MYVKCAAEIQAQVQCVYISGVYLRVQLPHNVHQSNTSVNLEFGDVCNSSNNKHGSFTRQASLASAGHHSRAIPMQLLPRPGASLAVAAQMQQIRFCFCCKLKIARLICMLATPVETAQLIRTCQYGNTWYVRAQYSIATFTACICGKGKVTWLGDALHS